MHFPYPRLRFGRLAQNGLMLLGWMLLRASMQAAIVLLLARKLGAAPYGHFVAIVAGSSFLTPFVGLGLAQMLLRNAARDPLHKGAYLGRALRCWGYTLPFCGILSVLLTLLLVPHAGSLIVLCIFVIAELSAASLTEIAVRYWQALQRTSVYGAINAGLPGVRLLAFLLLFAYNSDAGINTVFFIYAVVSVLYSAGLWLSLILKVRNTDLSPLESMTAWSGLPFSFAAVSNKLQGEFNKPLLAQVGFGFAGTYNVAQRTIDMICLPLLALQEVLWPRLYSQPNPGRQLLRTGGLLLLLALLFGVVLWLAAPLLPNVIGTEFSDSVWILRMLACMPLLQVGRGLITFHAVHHGNMWQLGWIYLIGGFGSIVSAIIFIPIYGLLGAVVSAYIVEFMIISFLMCGRFFSRC